LAANSLIGRFYFTLIFEGKIMSKSSTRHAVLESEERSLETTVCEHCGYEYPRLVGDECPNCGYLQTEVFDNPGKRWIAYLYDIEKEKLDSVFGMTNDGHPGWIVANRYGIKYAIVYSSREKLAKGLITNKWWTPGRYYLLISDGSRYFMYDDGHFYRVKI
jgi:hypothetical protein